MKKKDISQNLMEKIQARTEIKIRMDTIEIWEAAIKEPEDFETLMLAIVRYCRDFSEPDFSKAKDQRLLKRLFNQEAAKQKNAAVRYAEICMKRSEAGKKGRRSSIKQVQANANKRNHVSADNDIDYGHGLDIEDIETDDELDRPAGPALTGVPPAKEEIVMLPDGFWDEEE